MDENKMKNLEAMKEFFERDMKIKETLMSLAPTEADDYDELSRKFFYHRQIRRPYRLLFPTSDLLHYTLYFFQSFFTVCLFLYQYFQFQKTSKIFYLIDCRRHAFLAIVTSSLLYPAECRIKFQFF